MSASNGLSGEVIKESVCPFLRLWGMILENVHYGPGTGGAFDHMVLGNTAIWVAASGFMIFLKIRARHAKHPAFAAFLEAVRPADRY